MSKSDVSDQIRIQQLKMLENRFTYHRPHGNQAQRYEEMRDAAHELGKLIVENTPSGREQSLALTKLDEVVFWANAAIARHETP